MSRIKGLNDKITLKRKTISAAITVWKGEKKTAKSAGKNLNHQFRIEAPPHLRRTIKNQCDAEERNGSLYVDKLTIVPAYEDEFKTFDSKMTAYNASQPLLLCDRQTIHTEFILDEQNYVQPIEANKPCPVAGTNHKCPHGCTTTGDFYFYIWELLLAGSAEFARLQVHGVEDNQVIADFLDNTKMQIGAIKESPFANDCTRTYIVYQLTRRPVKSKYPIMEGGKRTAKRGTREDWIVNLALAPMWVQRYEFYQQSQQLQIAGHTASMRLIEQVYGENAIAAAAPAKVLPAMPASSFESFKTSLASAYKNNGWTKDGWLAMMRDEFGTEEVGSNLDLELLLAIANSGEEREKWCEF